MNFLFVVFLYEIHFGPGKFTIYANQDVPYTDGRYTIRFGPTVGSVLTTKKSPLMMLVSEWFRPLKLLVHPAVSSGTTPTASGC